MAEPEGFVSRWSRLKREAAAPPPAEPDAVPSAEPCAALSPVPDDVEETPTLPPLESLGGDSDYSPFLAPNVPEELHRLALRKAWTSNTTIASFRGFGEYDWDCNAPGYGQLLPTDDIVRLCRAVLGERKPEAPEADRGPSSPDMDPSQPVEVPALVATTPIASAVVFEGDGLAPPETAAASGA